MKVLIKALLVMVAPLLFWACSSDVPLENFVNEETNAKGNQYSENLSEAILCVQDLMKEMDTDPITRSQSRTVESVKVVTDNSTRGEENTDSILFLINFNDDMGFALLDAKANNGGIYAIAPKGHLDFNDSIGNPLLREFFDNTYALAHDTAKATAETRAEGPIVIGWKYVKYDVTERVNPKLSYWIAGWKGDSVALAGNMNASGEIVSAATAIAKIFAYYRYPDLYWGVHFEWDLIIDKQNPVAVQHLLYTLNRPTLLEDKEEDFNKGGGDDKRNIPPQRVQDIVGGSVSYYFDIACDSPKSEFTQKVKNLLRGVANSDNPGHPVIAYAYPTNKKTGYAVHNHFQYWIIDGFIDRNMTPLDSKGHPLRNPSPTPTLYHCVWGKGSYNDGYYAFNNGTIDNVQHLSTNNTTQENESQAIFPSVGAIGGKLRTVPPQPEF